MKFRNWFGEGLHVTYINLKLYLQIIPGKRRVHVYTSVKTDMYKLKI